MVRQTSKDRIKIWDQDVSDQYDHVIEAYNKVTNTKGQIKGLSITEKREVMFVSKSFEWPK